jgi:hypothetical protein
MTIPISTKVSAMRKDARAMEGAMLFKLGSDERHNIAGSSISMTHRRSQSIVSSRKNES